MTLVQILSLICEDDTIKIFIGEIVVDFKQPIYEGSKSALLKLKNKRYLFDVKFEVFQIIPDNEALIIILREVY